MSQNGALTEVKEERGLFSGLKGFLVGGSDSGESVVLVADHSASMAGRKISLLRDSLINFLAVKEGLAAGHNVGLIVFDNTLEVLSKPSADYRSMAGKVPGIRAAGSTVLAPALLRARVMLEGAKSKKRIVLMSDGWVSDVRKVKEIVLEFAGKIIVDTIAFTSEADINLMRDIAAVTGGEFFHVHDDSLPMLSEVYGALASKEGGSYLQAPDDKAMLLKGK